MGNKPSEAHNTENSHSSINTSGAKELRLGLFGESLSGKSALLMQFTTNTFVEPCGTVEDIHRKSITVSGKTYMLDIIDTADDEEHETLLNQHIQRTQGFIIVYSITDRSSFDNCSKFYQSVLRMKDVDRVPVVLVGNKADLEADRVVSKADGEELAKQYGWTFIEASAKNRTNVDEIFIEISKLTAKYKQPELSPPK